MIHRLSIRRDFHAQMWKRSSGKGLGRCQNIYVCVGSRENPLHPSRALSLSRVLWKSAYWRSNMNPKSIPKQARKWIEELFCWFQVLRQHFMFLSFCIHLHAFSFTFLSFACIFLSCCIHLLSLSFHVPFMFAFMSLHFPFILYSFHIPFMFIPMCIHVLSSSFHLHAFSFHFAFMSFHFLSKVMGNGSMAWPGDRVQQIVMAKLSLRLSLNNPSNI